MSRGCVVKASGGVVGAAVAALLAAMVLASPAGATPKGIFGVFGGCPVSDVGNELCVYMQMESGVLIMGRTMVPIDRVITVQAGARGAGEPNVFDLLAPRDGAIMSKAPIEVPGGLNGLLQCGAISGRLAQTSCGAAAGTEVTATVEVVASSSYPATVNPYNLFGEKTALVLPVRVHLGNVFLGSSCYVGSGSHPMILEMTDGATSPPAPNKPIRGRSGFFNTEDENGLEVLALGPSMFVNNTFSVPVAEGCGGQFSSLVDSIVDAKLGLPSKAGHNTAILDATAVDLATVEAVISSEG